MNKKPEGNEVIEKIVKGVQKAVRKLVIESAARNEELVTGDENGNVLIVPAKDLLKYFTEDKKAPAEIE